jgi:hypothetical protein
MPILRAPFVSPFLSIGLALAPLASGQSSFRPLPDSALLHSTWAGDLGLGGVPPDVTARTAALFESLEQAAELQGPTSFSELRFDAWAGRGGDFSGAPGSLATQRGSWTARLARRLGGGELVSFEVETEASFYDLGGATQLVPGNSDPFNDLYRARFAASVATDPAEEVSFFTGVEATLGGEDEVDPLDALTAGGMGGVRYRASEDLALSLGIAAQSRLEDDTWIWPFVAFDWRLGDDLVLSAAGPRLELRGALDERWTGLLRADYEMRQYRLNDDGPLPDGVLRDEEIHVGAGLEYEAGRNVSLQLLGGATLWRELNVLDEGGSQVSETEVEASPFVAFTLRASL